MCIPNDISFIEGEEELEGDGFGALSEGLLNIFEFLIIGNKIKEVNPNIILREAQVISLRVIQNNLGVTHFHYLYNEQKKILGSYHAATISLVMMYALISALYEYNNNVGELLSYIENRYHLRPWMIQVKDLVTKMNFNHHSRPFSKIIYQVKHADIHIDSPGNIIANKITTRGNMTSNSNHSRKQKTEILHGRK